MEFMSPLEHGAMFGNERERPLLQMKLGAFLYSDFRVLGSAAKCRKHRNLRIEPQAVIAPMARRDHPAIKIEDPLQLVAVECRDRTPVPRMRKRRHHAQALLTFGLG